jgi:hypothetical protein
LTDEDGHKKAHKAQKKSIFVHFVSLCGCRFCVPSRVLIRMFPEFTLDGDATPREPLTPEENLQLERVMSRYLKPEEQQRLERLLLERLKRRKAELQTLWEELNGHWGYEDGFYRFYHGSFKVYLHDLR